MFWNVKWTNFDELFFKILHVIEHHIVENSHSELINQLYVILWSIKNSLSDSVLESKSLII